MREKRLCVCMLHVLWTLLLLCCGPHLSMRELVRVVIHMALDRDEQCALLLSQAGRFRTCPSRYGHSDI